jgi:hypothetical protein
MGLNLEDGAKPWQTNLSPRGVHVGFEAIDRPDHRFSAGCKKVQSPPSKTAIVWQRVETAYPNFLSDSFAHVGTSWCGDHPSDVEATILGISEPRRLATGVEAPRSLLLIPIPWKAAKLPS